MNVIPGDRHVTRVDVAYHGLTYNLWVRDGHVIITVGCHVVRLTPDEVDEIIGTLTVLAARARP